MRTRSFKLWILVVAALLIDTLSAAGASWAQSDKPPSRLWSEFSPERFDENDIDKLNERVPALVDFGDVAEATRLAMRSIALTKARYGEEHPRYAAALKSFARVLMNSHRLADAEPLYRRALAIDEKTLGTDHPTVADDVDSLSRLLSRTNRLTEAEPLMRRSLAINEKSFGREHLRVAGALDSLVELLRATNRLAEAEPLMRRTLIIYEKTFANEKWPGTVAGRVDISIEKLATLLQATNQLAEAELLMRRALAMREESFGPDDVVVGDNLNELAILRAELGDWAEAAQLHRRAARIEIGNRSKLGIDDGSWFSALSQLKFRRNTANLRASARAVHRADNSSAESRTEGFELAQWALQNGAADALAQMTARFARGVGPLASLVRERQDLVVRHRAKLKDTVEELAKGFTPGALTRVTKTDDHFDGRLAAIDQRLAAEFPEYLQLSNPKPLTIAAVQDLLRPNEALVLFLDVPRFGKLPEETLAWAVTKENAHWISVPLGTAALAERIAKLRCGLDRGGLWTWSEKRKRWDANGERCRAFAPSGLAEDDPLPFDLGTAHELYVTLLAPFADLTKGKRLIIIPSGPLTSLPFHVLVTEPAVGVMSSGPDNTAEPSVSGSATQAKAGAMVSDPKGRTPPIAWLALSRSITVLPSAGSLAALRKLPPSQASEPYIAFGNPLLDGNPKDADHRDWAKAALAKQSCPLDLETMRRRQAAATAESIPVLGGVVRSGRISLAALRFQTPLPETADELCRVAKALGALGHERETVWLGARATEANLKALSRDGKLARYRVLHFATHGLLAGESEAILKTNAEPALILTPPKDGATPAELEEDDGLVTASEVAQLELDADWVVLSACNTAAGEKGDAEALSGLARAFFYAKARALLVSHWYVASEATVKLTTGAFEEIGAHPEIGRADALRRSMARLILSGIPNEAQPEYWGPFVLVGEGAGQNDR